MKRWSLVFVLSVLGGLLPITPARAATQIEFLNPSGYTTNTQLSDKTDVDGSYHLVAWVQDVPSAPLVEFEIQPTAGLPVTIDGTRVGNDTWEAFLSLSTFADGQYTLRARIYSNLTEIDTGERIVTISSNDPTPPPDPNTVEMVYPSNGDPAGFFTPKDKPATIVIDGIASAEALQARALYTLSDQGSNPEWTACGSAGVANDDSVRVLCTLAPADLATDVTGLALVANMTPAQTLANPAADQTGDAHRIEPYAQVPTTVSIDPEATTLAPPSCGTFVTTITDQFDRPIASANLDIHAVGPDDQLRFGSQANTTSAYQGPDKGHVSSENSWNCTDNQASTTTQGDHNVPGQDDAKHIESTSGTNKNGSFTFAIRADSVGPTAGEVWVDVDDDDVPDLTEASGGFRIGWGEAPPEPVTTVELEPSSSSPTTSECQRLTAVLKRGGNPIATGNVDLHITGPDPTIAFCSVTGGSTLRIPDQGHIGDTHEDGARHAETESDASGQVVFGVTSATEGATQVALWFDAVDDDVQSGEPGDTAALSWQPVGARSVSLETDKTLVRKGRNARLSGAIEGSNTCRGSQPVSLERKRIRRGRFTAIDASTTDSSGNYEFVVQINNNRKYRVRAPAAGVCEEAVSNVVVIRLRT